MFDWIRHWLQDNGDVRATLVEQLQKQNLRLETMRNIEASFIFERKRLYDKVSENCDTTRGFSYETRVKRLDARISKIRIAERNIKMEMKKTLKKIESLTTKDRARKQGTRMAERQRQVLRLIKEKIGAEGFTFQDSVSPSEV